MKPNWVWIVEMQYGRRGEWRPTVGVALDRTEGRKKLAYWKSTHPHDAFRLRQYVRKELR